MMTGNYLIPCLNCYGKTSNDKELLNCSRSCSDNGADALLIHDCSADDVSHEEAIGRIKEIVRTIDIPVITGGNIKRLEDVKKYLYAGAEAVYLDAANEDHIDLIKESADRFGSEKIFVRISAEEQLVRVEEYQQLGATMIILAISGAEPDTGRLPEARYLITCSRNQATDMAAYLQVPQIEGVLLTIPDTQIPRCMEWKQELNRQGIPVHLLESSISWESFKKGDDGLVPVIVQDYKTSEVLMLAYMNEEAFENTLRSGRMTYFSRSRNSLWVKGETSGHYQYIKSLAIDCDQDTILAKVKQLGAACHTGSRTCFYTELASTQYKETNPLKVFEDVFAVIADRKENPKDGSYTNYLFDKGIDKILKKLGEEATEIVIAAKNPNPEEIKYEISDFLYHMMVLMAEKGITWEDITGELANR